MAQEMVGLDGSSLCMLVSPTFPFMGPANAFQLEFTAVSTVFS